ncbi:MAG: hypothetical protein HKN43_02620 [Rhodothermales bacterium]|nr:hypothetical protein [Rhodothermales bacterium]
MRILQGTLTLVLLCSLVQISHAQDGRYATHDGSQMVEQLPDGSSVMTSHYSQITFANDMNNLMDNMSGDCMGRFMISAEGVVGSASGTCVNDDGDGNTASFWWRMDKMNTADCADMCGSWGYYAGTGALKGINGNGTWERTKQFSNGSSGFWSGTVTTM